MKPIIVTSVILLAAIAGEAIAVCPTGAILLQRSDMRSLLVTPTNVYVCGNQYDGQYFNETLTAVANVDNGTVTDYKRGPANATDPSEVLGTYVLTNNPGGSDTITYNYTGGGGSFTYVIARSTVGQTGFGAYSFCQTSGPNAGTSIPVTVQSGNCAVQP